MAWWYFFKSHIPSRRLNDFKISSNIQTIPFEINLRNENSLVASIHNAPFQKKKIFSRKVVNLGDFKIEVENKVLKSFLQEHTFYNMMKQNTYFEGDRGSCIDLLIANSRFSFMKANSFKTGLSDHYHMIHTIFKTKFEKFKPKKSIYRNFKPIW